MPELPEIRNLSRQMDRALRGKRIDAVDIVQPKCLNVRPATFRKLLAGRTIDRVTSRGKWLFVHLDTGVTVLISLGMGGDLLLHKSGAKLPEKWQLKLDFADGSHLTVRFWWFGYIHALSDAKLSSHKMTATLGLDPLDPSEFTWERFSALLERKRGSIKSLLMDQRYIAGIGNVYIQDILFGAGLHPGAPIARIGEDRRRALHGAIVANLTEATRLGGLKHERDLFNRHGRFSEFLVGYRQGKPCPRCGSEIRKIRTGSTATFICPTCQPALGGR